MLKLLLLNEGKKQAYAILKDMDLVEKLAEIDPTPSKKYVEVFARILKNNLDRTDFWLNRLGQLRDIIIQAEAKQTKLDVSNISTFGVLADALERVVTRVSRKSINSTLGDLVKGRDYSIVFENDKVIGIMPFNWEASQYIASKEVGGLLGDWCIAYTTTRENWDDYTQNESQAPVMMIVMDSSKEKYCFMFGENKMDIWDQDDIHQSYTKPILEALSISGEELSTLNDLAREQAFNHIENFGDGQDIITNVFMNTMDFSSSNLTFSGSMYVEERSNRDDYNRDTEGYESYEGEIHFANDFFGTKKGIQIVKDLRNEYEDDDLCDIINGTLVVEYEDESYSAIKNRIENRYSWDETYEDYPDREIKTLYSKNNIKTIVLVAPTAVDVDSDDYFISSLKHSIKRSDRTESTFYELATDNYTLYISTFGGEQAGEFIEGLKSIPNLYKYIMAGEDEFIRDDEREASYGQQFLQYEHAKVMQKLKQYKEKRKDLFYKY